MSSVAIAFNTKDRIDLTAQSIEPLLQSDKFHLYWIDGSTSEEGKAFPFQDKFMKDVHADGRALFNNVRGGAGAGMVFALSKMLGVGYDYVGLVENDVVLPEDWFEPTMDLFARGAALGLRVGAVSARCYADRVLFQQDGFAVCHNLGAGMVVFSAAAARLVLDRFRSGWTTDNRRIFSQLSGVDIGPFWAFQGSDHNLVADWHWDAMLAANGFASLALTPSYVEMIGQDPPLEQQGLSIVKEPVRERCDDASFGQYVECLGSIANCQLHCNVETHFQYHPDHGWMYPPHQWKKIGAMWSDGWRFRENRAFGEFAYVAKAGASVTFPVFGMGALLLTGGKQGSAVKVQDLTTGYHVSPVIAPEGTEMKAIQIPLPGQIVRRLVTLTAVDDGVTIVRLTTREPQMTRPNMRFIYDSLPRVL